MNSGVPTNSPMAGVPAVLAALHELAGGAPHLSNDSRRLNRGEVFVAYPGARADGRVFIDEAFERGALAVLAEAAGLPERAWPGPVLPVAGLQAMLGELSAALYGHPSAHLSLVGVTGTNGKTSITQWIAGTLAAEGRRCAQIGTLGNGFPNDLDPSANTTPDALAVHGLLARYLDAGASACCMEASSIGLDQGRCDGAAFEVAVFSNLTRDHLDYHGTMEAYAAAKRRLFLWPGLKAAVINLDDPFGETLLNDTRAPRRIGYALSARPAPDGLAGAGFDLLWAADIADTPRGIAFTLHYRKYRYLVEAPVVGRYNVANLLAVGGTLLALGVDSDRLPELLSGVSPPPGRMQRFGGVQAPLVAVDYAHTPDALENALGALQPATRARGGRLICVFGCGGDRDKGKRPLMGEVAVRLADQVWLTSDNPRSEDPDAIIDDIALGERVAERARRQVDRRLAIETAIAEADERDVILVAGKGHEDYQEIRGQKLPYSDPMAVNAALANRREGAEKGATPGSRAGLWSLAEAAAAAGGELLGATDAAAPLLAVSTDSRRGNAGALFVALIGERFDAHDFVAEVARQGAAAALVSRDRAASLRSCGLPLIAVDDTRRSLGLLAAAWRRRFTLPLIGVTGSNGKTTTKDMIAAILREQVLADGGDPEAGVLATQGNLNNDVGLPLTLLQLNAAHRYAVIEMGMNHPGEITWLAGLARPNFGLVTNALRAHLEGMGSQDGVAQEKGCLYEQLANDGTAVIDADSEFAGRWQTQAGLRQTKTFSFAGKGDVNAECEPNANGSRLLLSTAGGAWPIFLQVVGRHNAHNAAAAATVCLAAGIGLPIIARGLEAFAGVKGRLQKKSGHAGATLYDDTYNANPDSMRAAIDVLAGCAAPRVLILGDMGETGAASADYHREVVDYARAQGIEQLRVLGEAMGEAVRAAGFGSSFATPEALADAVRPGLDEDTTVLVKGSRFMKMERVVALLEQTPKENPSCS